MAANSDQIRRDAEHAARARLSVFLSKYQRRMYELAKAEIAQELSRAEGGVDGTALGYDAADRAISALVSGEAADVIDGTPALEPAAD